MSENVIVNSLVKNCEDFGEKAASLAKEQAIEVNNRAVFLQSLLETAFSCVADISKKNEDMTSATDLVSNLLKLEIKKFVNKKEVFDQTLGKIIVTNEIVNYAKLLSSQEKSKKEEELEAQKLANDSMTRVKERIDLGEDISATSRKIGEHPEKLKNIRNLKDESEKN
tara:strand:+ start:1745 stop:2248 length:504 start_codon:yes stop_codon:yes gene_type:complete